MKKHYALFLLLGAAFLTASKCSEEQITAPSPEEQKSCLEACGLERQRIIDEYDRCVDESIITANAVIDRCIDGPPADRGECLRLAREALLQAIARCKSTRDSALQSTWGCEGKCHVVDPPPTK